MIGAIGGILLTPITMTSYDVGIMLGLKGFVAAVVLAAIFGFLRGGADGVGRGLVVW